jgi:hypothetical protein
VGGEPLERRPPQRLLIVGAVTRAWGGSWSGAAVANGAGWSSELPLGRCMAGAEPQHGVVVGAVTDGDRGRGPGAVQIERERERERSRPEQVRRCGGERDKDIVWIRRRDGDFLGAGVLFQISFTCGACSNFFW